MSVVFFFLDGVLWNTECLNFDDVQFIFFFSLDTLVFGVISKKSLPNLRSQRLNFEAFSQVYNPFGAVLRMEGWFKNALLEIPSYSI